MLKGRIVSGKIVSILLAATMMAGCILTGCGSAESGSLEAADKVAETANAPAAGNGEEGPGGTSGEPAEVSVIIETFDNTFASFVMNAMKKYEEEHKDKIHITYLDSKQDANTQISQVDSQRHPGHYLPGSGCQAVRTHCEGLQGGGGAPYCL